MHFNNKKIIFNTEHIFILSSYTTQQIQNYFKVTHFQDQEGTLFMDSFIGGNVFVEIQRRIIFWQKTSLQGEFFIHIYCVELIISQCHALHAVPKKDSWGIRNWRNSTDTDGSNFYHSFFLLNLIYTDLVITNDEIWIVRLLWYATALLFYNLKEVWMVHGFTCCKSFLMIITE